MSAGHDLVAAEHQAVSPMAAQPEPGSAAGGPGGAEPPEDAVDRCGRGVVDRHFDRDVEQPVGALGDHGSALGATKEPPLGEDVDGAGHVDPDVRRVELVGAGHQYDDLVERVLPVEQAPHVARR